MEQEEREAESRYFRPFFAAYFFYYAGYCVFSSFIVLFLTERGYSAAVCGVITSLTLLANLLMEPVGGYLTDTYLSARSYLTVCIGVITGLCLLATLLFSLPAVCVAALVLTAGLAYPFSQLMDAWVNCSRELDSTLVYSRVRAGGSIGFALASMAAGYYFEALGWGSYFLVQAALFLIMLPFLFRLPKIELRNRGGRQETERRLSMGESFRVILREPRYLMCLLTCTLYWFSHRPVGSYLSLIVQDRAGGTNTFGMVCGIGAMVEFFSLMALGRLQRGRGLPLGFWVAAALVTDILRPLCLRLFPGIVPLYLGQIAQSFSFAFYLGSSVEWFTRTAHPRLRSFSISMGLTVSSVVGTVLANLLGGWLCDGWGTGALVLLSLAISLGNCAIYLFLGKRLVPLSAFGGQ